MDSSIIHADIFFFVTTVALIIFAVIGIIASWYIIATLRNIRDISRTLKHGVDNAEGRIEEICDDIEDSAAFRFIFGRKKQKRGIIKKK